VLLSDFRSALPAVLQVFTWVQACCRQVTAALS
jgi:hypothetical protein